MTSRWLRIFEVALEKEIDHAITTLSGGFCQDYGAYCKEVGKIEAYRTVLEIAARTDESFIKGD